jgi:hypothetical protein
MTWPKGRSQKRVRRLGSALSCNYLWNHIAARHLAPRALRRLAAVLGGEVGTGGCRRRRLAAAARPYGSTAAAAAVLG